ncbi:MAG: ribonuclease R [Coriobacteriia bacterium]
MPRPKRLNKAKMSGLLVGRISMNRKGFGFVSAPEGDIYIGAGDTHGAMHGDTVGIRVSGRAGKKGRDGTVVKVLERANEVLVGRFEQSGRLGIVIPSDTRIRHDVFVPHGATAGAVTGDMVMVRLTAYPSRNNAAQGVVEEVIGHEGDPGIDIEIVIREHTLRTEFPEEALTAAEAVQLDADEALRDPHREDIRDWFTITIDPVDARDFDDAITCERRDGGFRLGVHIADVSHYVPWDGPVDLEARKRATSVYLVDRVLPMLPEHLSNNICSLNPDEDRLSFSVVMDLDRDGVVLSKRLFRSVMRSDRRFNYGQVQRCLEGEESFPDAESETLLRDFAQVTELIGHRRIARGGLDFETVEAKVRLDETGKPLEVVVRERTQATNMIEEAMILANEAVAQHMTEAEAPMVYRIHEDPDADALSEVAVILREFDYPIKDLHGASPATFQKIIRFAHNRPEKRLINSLVLRAMQRARYVHYLAPHFGLASDAYCHFTSPIRRYPDLLVHQLLAAQLSGNIDKDPASSIAPELEWLSEHCSLMEREAESAENETVRIKLSELMNEHLGEEFEGIITGVYSYGLFIQLDNTAEGLVHVRSMTDDYYQLDSERFLLRGEDRGRIFRLGQRVTVRILSVSIAEGRIDMEIA